MGWSKTAPTLPSGASYSSETRLSCENLYYFGYRAYISIARLTANQVAIRFRLDQIYGTGGSAYEKPPNYWHLVAGSSTSNGYAWADRTVYWTGALNAGASISAQVGGWTGSDVSSGSLRSTTLTGPAYVTKYTVTYNRNGGTGGTESASVTYGGAYPGITVPTRTGFTFNGYFSAASGGTRYYNANGTAATTAAVTANITLYAQWTANTYTVTLDAQGGTGGSSSITATYGEDMPAITVPTRTGYTFGGYYSGTDGSGIQYYSAAGASANKWNTAAAGTLRAKWTPNTYTVRFDSQSGTACDSVSVTYGAAYGTLPTPTRTNYTFGGWFTDAQSGTQITSTTTVSITADQTLYAHWTLNAVTITYYGNGAGAANVPAPQDKLIGATATISATVPTRAGFTFLEWNTAANGSGTAYSGGDSYSTDAPLSLFAQWAAIPVVSDVTAVRCNSSGVSTDTDADTYAVIGFDWSAASAVSGVAYTIRWVNREDALNTGIATGTLSGTGGTVAGIICGAASGAASAIETAYQYDITVTVTDSNGGAGTADDFVSRAYYVLDFTAGGTGVGIGAPAKDGRITTGLGHTADAEERGTHYELINNATDTTLLRSLDWDGNETILGDLTAGGDITDGAGNVLSEKADVSDTCTKAEILALLTSFRASVLLAAHPVGSTFESEDPTSPAELFGGEWVRIKDVFTLAAGDTYAAGSTGGAAAVTLTADQSGLRSHHHGSGQTGAGLNTNFVRVVTGATIERKTLKNGTGTSQSGIVTSNQAFGPVTNTASVSALDAAEAHNNMPPYVAMYKWKRVA